MTLATITFVITNSNHHHAMMFPVAKELARRGHVVKFASFCEFRGLTTPVAELREAGFPVSRIPPFKIRPTPESTDGLLAVVAPGSRNHIYTLAWYGLLKMFLKLGKPDVVVVPNDSVFPCNYLCAQLKLEKIPFVLVQEGIRFPLPCEGTSAYGTGGGDVACWGQGSADYFASQGVPKHRLHVTGNPRYDAIVATDWKAEAARLRAAGQLPHRYIMFATNPIDTQGLCSLEAKLESFRSFVEQSLPVLDQAGVALAVKLHGREPEATYRAALGPQATRLVFLRGGSVHAQLAGCETLVVWASTVGLEGLMHGAELAVLDVPGRGHIFDYVSRSVALGLRSSDPMAPQIEKLLAGSADRRARAADYVEWHLACRGASTTRTASLVEACIQ